jgi:N-acetylmuramic acid 6-phosphate etherase
MASAKDKARHFIDNETEFHLGDLPTENAHPKTRGLSRTIQADTAAGVRMILEIDQDLPPVVEKVFSSEQFEKLIGSFTETLRQGKKIFFTGCGSTGRLSILLEAIWRRFWQGVKSGPGGLPAKLTDMENHVFSVMSGGDFALIKAVEGFEDFTDFGRYQLEEGGVAAGDTVVAITEGGETSFVIGTAWKGLDVGANVFFVFNNPADVLAKHVKRSREVIEETRITKLDLAAGPMAIAGSTRMQATTSELAVVGAALEMAIVRFFRDHLSDAEIEAMGIEIRTAADYADLFVELLDDLRSPAAVAGMSQMIEFEEAIYRKKGLVTYLADDYMPDILTDTTERSPTFRIPPFRKYDDTVSPRSWAFVKNPTLPSDQAWLKLLRRSPRGLNWTAETYRQLNAPAELQANPPKLDNAELMQFQIGFEPDASRYAADDSAAMMVLVGSEIAALTQPANAYRQGFDRLAEKFHQTAGLFVGPDSPPADVVKNVFHVPCRLPSSPLDLWGRLAIKMTLNAVSTATCCRLGRVDSNWMVYVQTSNKKLIDRASRLIAELAGVSYDLACYALFDTLENSEQYKKEKECPPSLVQLAIERIRAGEYR